jgi:hypothetical protein
VSGRQQHRIALTFRDVDRAFAKRDGTAAALVAKGDLHAVDFFGEKRVPLEEVMRFVAAGTAATERRPRARARAPRNVNDTSPIGIENL